jgi:hypothetical protein
MTPGTALRDPHFKYEDGTTGLKRCVVLNDGTCGFYLVIKTTSRVHHKGRSSAHCQHGDAPPNFYLQEGICGAFSTETWILLDPYHERETKPFETRVTEAYVETLGVMEPTLFAELLDCVIRSHYLDRDYKMMLIPLRAQIGLALRDARKRGANPFSTVLELLSWQSQNDA